ncbi:MAG: LemA family protein [Polyangiaceae bacterium]
MDNPIQKALAGARALLVFTVLAIAAVALPGCGKYDELVQKDTVAQQRWADIEAQLQRRYDLIPNLVNIVKASAKHEEGTLAAVTAARARATGITMSADDLTDPEKVKQFQAAQDQLSGTLSRLLVVQEAYPDLKANQGFRDLQVQLEGTENRVLRSREQYNEAVSDYNATLAKIGGSVVNKVTGKPFKPRVFFSASAEAQGAPKVSFD